MVIRLLDLALLTFVVWMVWSHLIRGWRAASMAASRGAAPDPPAGAAAPGEPPMNLVRCGACGVHVPSARTLPGPVGTVFCSEACRAAGARPSS